MSFDVGFKKKKKKKKGFPTWSFYKFLEKQKLIQNDVILVKRRKKLKK